MRGGAVSSAAFTALKQPLSRLGRAHLSTTSSHRSSGARLGGNIRKASTVPHSVSHFPHGHQFEPGVILKGYSGREYTIENVLQDRQDRQVYLARYENQTTKTPLKMTFFHLCRRPCGVVGLNAQQQQC